MIHIDISNGKSFLNLGLNKNNGHFPVFSLDLSRVFGIRDMSCFLCFSLPSWCLGTQYLLDSFLFLWLSCSGSCIKFLYIFSSQCLFSVLTPFSLLGLQTSYLSYSLLWLEIVPSLETLGLYLWPRFISRNSRLTNKHWSWRVLSKLKVSLSFWNIMIFPSRSVSVMLPYVW